jgi:hypothetical protein
VVHVPHHRLGGGKVDVTHMRALTRLFGEVITDLGPAAPTSLAGLAPREWQQQFAPSARSSGARSAKRC